MAVFGCAGCGAVLTAAVSKVALPVPVDAALWAELAFPPHRTRLPVVGGLPAGVERDDPLPPHPCYPFQPSREAFRYTLARMPAVREPWLRAIHDRGRG